MGMVEQDAVKFIKHYTSGGSTFEVRLLNEGYESAVNIIEKTVKAAEIMDRAFGLMKDNGYRKVVDKYIAKARREIQKENKKQ